jgi:thymidine kinase
VDTGATHHLVNTTDLIDKYYNRYTQICAANGELSTPGQQVRLKKNIFGIERAIYHRDLRFNLFSVSEFCKTDRKIVFEKSKATLHMQNEDGTTFEFETDKVGNLYTLQVHDTTEACVTCSKDEGNSRLNGKLTVHAGCMWSGKSTAMFEKIDELVSEKKGNDILKFTHNADTREPREHEKVHKPTFTKVNSLNELEIILRSYRSPRQILNIFVDELHMFDDATTLKKILTEYDGRHEFYLSGLDKNGNGEDFEWMKILKDMKWKRGNLKLKIWKADCNRCGMAKSAINTLRIAKFEDPNPVGGADKYGVYCKKCTPVVKENIQDHASPEDNKLLFDHVRVQLKGVPKHIQHERLCHFWNSSIRIPDNCKSCKMHKGQKPSHAKERPPEFKPKRYLESVHMDLVGPFPAALGGGAEKYMFVAVDDLTNYLFVTGIRRKDDAHLALEEMFTHFGRRPERIRTDNGGEWETEEFKLLVNPPDDDKKKIVHERSPPYEPESNGKVERNNRSLGDATRATVEGCDPRLWLYAAVVSAYVFNRLPRRNADSPLQIKHREEGLPAKPDKISHLRTFGCRVYFKMNERTKIQERYGMGIMVGYAPGCYRVLKPTPTGRWEVIKAYAVKFMEEQKVQNLEEFAKEYQKRLHAFSDANYWDALPNSYPAASKLSLPSGGRLAAGGNAHEDVGVSGGGAVDTGNSVPSRWKPPEERFRTVWCRQTKLRKRIPILPEDKFDDLEKPTIDSMINNETDKDVDKVADTTADSIEVPNTDSENPTDKNDNPNKDIMNVTGVHEKPATSTTVNNEISGRPESHPKDTVTFSTEDREKSDDLNFDDILPNRKRKLSEEDDRDPKRPKFHNSEKALTTEALDFLVGNVSDTEKLENLVYALGAIKTSEAEKGPEKYLWKAAAVKELNALLAKKTWDHIDFQDIPVGGEVIPVCLIYTLKNNGVYKARGVVLGNQQQNTEDLMTYSPVISHSTLRYVLHMAALQNLEMSNFDISAAFVNADISGDVYCRLPGAWVEKGKSPYVKLNKALYGLRQAPRLWSRHFTASLRKLGFVQSEADPGLYYAQGKMGVVYCCIYVDDGILIGHKDDTEFFRSQILTTFVGRNEPLEKNGHIEKLTYVGLEITRDRKKRKIWLTQNDLVKKLEERFKSYLTTDNPEYKDTGKRTPITRNLSDGPEIKFPIRKAVGSLMYLAQGSRPDLCYAIKEMSRYLEKPTKEAAKTAIRCIKYVIDTRNYGVVLGNTDGTLNEDHNPVMNAYSDADFASEPGKRRSTTGNVIRLDNSTIWWKCVLQKLTATSTCEAEYYSAFNCAKQIMHMRVLHEEFRKYSSGNFEKNDDDTVGGIANSIEPTKLLVDNTSTITVLKSDLPTTRSKHFEVKLSYVADKVERNLIKLEWVNTLENIADMLTKPRPWNELLKLGIEEVGN